MMQQVNVLHTGPFCSGAPPATCGPEQLTMALDATELSMSAGRLSVYATLFWGSSSAGIQRVLFYNSANFQIYWDQTTYQWVFVGGGQTVKSAIQSIRRELARVHVVVTWQDGSPITIQVNGETAVSSVGNYSAPALGVTTYIGSSSGGGDEINAHISELMIERSP